MYIILTELETGETLTFPMLPEEITVRTSAAFQSYAVLNIGEVKIPKGQQLKSVSWEGTFPGARRSGISLLDGASPRELDSVLSLWRQNGSKLRLMITESPVNDDVYLSEYEARLAGAFGDYRYTLTFVEAREMKLYTVSELNIKPNAATNKPKSSTRPNPRHPKTYTVVKGDSLWRIAQKFLGKGIRYTEIAELNKDKIKEPNLILPGMVLRLPE